MRKNRMAKLVRWDFIALGGAALVLMIAITVRPAPENPLRFEVVGSSAYVDGVSDGRSEGAVRALLRDHPQVDRLIFRDMPGTRDVTSNDRLARSIRNAGLTTQLTPSSRIASGAVDLFIAGETRIGACGAMVGVHAWGTDGYDAQDVKAGAMTWDTHRATSRRFLSDMGINPDFYDFRTDAAGSDDIHWMSAAEQNQWGLTTQPLDCRAGK